MFEKTFVIESNSGLSLVDEPAVWCCTTQEKRRMNCVVLLVAELRWFNSDSCREQLTNMEKDLKGRNSRKPWISLGDFCGGQLIPKFLFLTAMFFLQSTSSRFLPSADLRIWTKVSWRSKKRSRKLIRECGRVRFASQNFWDHGICLSCAAVRFCTLAPFGYGCENPATPPRNYGLQTGYTLWLTKIKEYFVLVISSETVRC